MQVYECIFSLISGVGVFILAMKIMSDSLKELAGDRMRTLLEKLASNRITGVLVGALVTAIIQSSSATTVMVIGFVNADVMTLNQAASIIIGSNIGTTVTGLLASLESLNISLYLSTLVFLGVMLSFIKKLKKIANLLTGLGMIFVGLRLMSGACNDDSIKDAFRDVLEKIKFPLLLELLGMVFTAIIQSSSAMTGIVIVMVGNEVMGMDNGLFITLGANVGTCITALIGIIGANINSKRTAVIHFIFNICGCLIFTPILWIFKSKILSILNSMVDNESMQIAYFHLFFNIVTALVTMPLIEVLVKIAKLVVSDEKPDQVIVETMEEKSNFEIGGNTTIDYSRNESSLIDISFINHDNKYEPPHILEDYIKKDFKQDYRIANKKNIKINDFIKEHSDNHSESNFTNEHNDNVFLIDVSEDSEIIEKDKNHHIELQHKNNTKENEEKIIDNQNKDVEKIEIEQKNEKNISIQKENHNIEQKPEINNEDKKEKENKIELNLDKQKEKEKDIENIQNEIRESKDKIKENDKKEIEEKIDKIEEEIKDKTRGDKIDEKKDQEEIEENNKKEVEKKIDKIDEEDKDKEKEKKIDPQKDEEETVEKNKKEVEKKIDKISEEENKNGNKEKKENRK